MNRFTFTALKALALGAALAVQAAAPASAQTTQLVNVSVTVPTLLKLTANSNSFAFGAPTDADFDAGFLTANTATTFTVKANRAWKVTVSPSGASMGTVGTYTKPLADFLWQTSGSFTPINAASPPDAASGTSGVNGASTGVNYQVLLDWTKDVPGTYNAMSVLYTLAAN